MISFRCAGGVAGVVLAIVSCSTASQAEPAERFAEVEAWEGEITFSGEREQDADGIVMTTSYKGRIQVQLDDSDVGNKRLKWSARAKIEAEGQESMRGETEAGKVDAAGSGSGSGETPVSLTIRPNEGNFEVWFQGFSFGFPVNGTMTDYNYDPPESGPIQTDAAITIRGVKTGPQPLPEDGLALSYAGPAGNSENIKLNVALWPAGQKPQRGPDIALDAPPCSCKTLAKDEAASLQVVVSATAGGEGADGKFLAFDIQYEGVKPGIVRQTLGASAEIEFDANEKTAPVTVRAVYRRKDGKLHYSEPRRIRFCFLREIELIDSPHNETDYSFNGTGKLTVNANAELWLDGRRGEFADIEWDMDEIGESALDKQPGLAYTAVRFEFDGLPLGNSDFGEKKITAKPTDAECECLQEKDVRVFFPPAAKNHPGKGVGVTPNWFYYWAQTPAMFGIDPIYAPGRRSCGGGAIVGQYVYADDALYLTDTVLTGSCAAPATGKAAKGFDCYAQTLRHENVHRAEFNAWYNRIGTHPGPISCMSEYGDDQSIATAFVNLGKWKTIDADRDLVPDIVEKELSVIGCDPDQFRSCSTLPKHLNVGDVEMNAYNVGWAAWPVCKNAQEDWSKDGKQWTKECG